MHRVFGKDFKMNRFEEQLAFILEIDKEKNILRQTHLSGNGRRENDAEHAWHMAVMAWLLKEYANEPVDIAKTMMMILIHDIVEIDAGDTYAYDKAMKETQAEREKAAAERLFGLLPKDQGEELKALFEEFEAGSTPEARFAKTMDNFQPLLLNDSNDGGDWVAHGVARSQIMERNEPTGKGSAFIRAYVDQIVDRHVAAGHIGDA